MTKNFLSNLYIFSLMLFAFSTISLAADDNSIRACQQSIRDKVQVESNGRNRVDFLGNSQSYKISKNEDGVRGSANVFLNNNNQQSISYTCTYNKKNKQVTQNNYTFDNGGNGGNGQYVAPGSPNYNNGARIAYSVHLADFGWTGWFMDGQEAGTTEQSRQMESIKILSPQMGKCEVKYRTNVSGRGWTNWLKNGEEAGTTGQKIPLTAIQIKTKNCNGKVEYRVHIATIGWQDWVREGDTAGNQNSSNAIEAIGIQIIPK